MSTTMQQNGQQTVPMGSPPSPSPPPPKSRRIAIIAAGAVLALAVLAIATVFIINQNHTTTATPPSQAYQTKLSATLTPIVSNNLTLSRALQAIDGSKSTLRVAKDAAATAQQQTVSARGAVAVLQVPVSQRQLDQQATQTLIQEAGYVQAVTSTLADPNSNASGSMQSLASATNSAFVPLNSYAAGGSTSIYGVDNLLSWVSGAQKAGRKPTVINNNTTTTTVVPGNTTTTVVPSSGGGQTAPDGAGDRQVNDTVGRPTITAGPNVSDGFARAILIAAAQYYRDNGSLPDGVTLSVTSPTTGSTYNVSYTTSLSGDAVFATNLDGSTSTGNDVTFPASDANGTG